MENTRIYLAIRLIQNGESSTLFKLHSQFRLTYTEALTSVIYLKDIGVVDFDGRVFSLKNTVTRKQLKELYKKVRFRKLNLEEKIINSYIENAINKNELYLPNLARLGSSLDVDD